MQTVQALSGTRLSYNIDYGLLTGKTRTRQHCSSGSTETLEGGMATVMNTNQRVHTVPQTVYKAALQVSQ